MRLPESKIKDALLHPERMARDEALMYFNNAYSRDPEVMLRAIEALETFGRRQAFLHVSNLRNLAQSEASLDWIVRELQQAPAKDDDTALAEKLSNLCINADPRILAPRAS